MSQKEKKNKDTFTICGSKFKNKLNDQDCNKEIKYKLNKGIYVYYENNYKIEYNMIQILNNLSEMIKNRIKQDENYTNEIINTDITDEIYIELINNYFKSTFDEDISKNIKSRRIDALDKYVVHEFKEKENKKKIYAKLSLEPTQQDIIDTYLYDTSPSKLNFDSKKDDYIFIIRNIKKTNRKTEKKIIEELELKYENLTIFTFRKMSFDLIKHFYVPKHSKLNLEDKKMLKKKLYLKNFLQLPHLLKTDSISKYYNYRYGDVIKIVRSGNQWANSKDGGSLSKHIVYRYVPKN